MAFFLKRKLCFSNKVSQPLCSLGLVTDGRRGSYLGVKGEAVYIPPCVPVDTGAGDAFASGILYGILRSVSELKVMCTLAARIAATDVGQQGTRLSVQDAVDIAESFAFNLGSSSVSHAHRHGDLPKILGES
ncbi:hypothetical protein PVK06_049095 [Gossypium arboreum]|uniref:Carbohydrate kinase PfkB domain-containing protein n=1 Tax=Gossypium arboreum TaxID=29729 RepID=A0ABR0MHN6_GOSAR|nr:hypothetical protein PVK06_049095 [Gossypium arboreum]